MVLKGFIPVSAGKMDAKVARLDMVDRILTASLGPNKPVEQVSYAERARGARRQPFVKLTEVDLSYSCVYTLVYT